MMRQKQDGYRLATIQSTLMSALQSEDSTHAALNRRIALDSAGPARPYKAAYIQYHYTQRYNDRVIVTSRIATEEEA